MSLNRLAIAFASALFLAGANFRPAAVATLSSGELAVLDSKEGVEKVSGTAHPVLVIGNFAVFEANSFAPLKSGDFLVTQQIRFKTETPFSSLVRYNASGKASATWRFSTGGVLTGLAVDDNGVAYCADSVTNTIYKFTIDRPGFVTLARVHDAGILGPIAVDAKRRRLLVGDVQKRRLLSVSMDDGKTAVLDNGTVAEPLAIAVDATNDRLFVADGAGRRVWMAAMSTPKLKLQKLSLSQKFWQPVGVAVARDGSLWVADGRQNLIWRFDVASGRTLQTLKP